MAVAFYDTGVYGTDEYSELDLVVEMVIRETQPLRLHWQAVTPGGRTYRWGEDEPSPENVPSGVSFSTTMPGGFEQASLTLPRKPARDYSDLDRLTTLTAYGPGGDVAWQGRLERAPRVSGDQMTVSPAAVGWQAHLEDDKSAAQVYVGKELSVWREVGRVRRLAFAPVNQAYGGMDQTPGEEALAGVRLFMQGNWAATSGFRAEAYYEAPANTKIASVYFAWRVNSTVGTDANFFLQAYSTEDEVTFPENSADQLAGSTSGTLTFTPTTPRREIMVQFGYHAGPAGDAGANYEAYLSDVAVIGNHGLTQRGTAPNQGFYASDIVEHAVGRFAPLLATDIQQSQYVVQQAVFLEPTTAGEIVRQMTRFSLQDWAVWEGQAGPTFYWHNRGQRGRSWRMRIAPAQLEQAGESAERLFQSVIVQFQDVDGTTRSVGPVGSGCDSEDDSLLDTDPENPATRLGITKRAVLTTGVTVAAEAVQIGARFLQEQKQLDASGSAQIVGHIEDDRGVLHPAWRVRAGDTVTFVDAADQGARRIVRTSYDHGTRTCSIDIDAPPEGMQALLERFGADLVAVGL